MLKKCNEDCYSNAIKMISTWADDMEEKNEKLKSECA